MDKRLLIIRHSAFGDAIHMSHLPRLMKEVRGFTHITVEVNPKAAQVLACNPYIDSLIIFDSVARRMTQAQLDVHWKVLGDGFDEVINLQHSIEEQYIAMEHMGEYYRDSEYRRAKYGNINYYDIAIDYGKLPKDFYGITGEIYFKDSEESAVGEFLAPYKDRFKVLINLHGSGAHKQFVNAKEVVRGIVEKYPEALIITTGDKDCEYLDFKIKDSISIVGKHGFRHAMLLAKHVNLVISPESGLAVASNAFNTPTIQLLTAASATNHTLYARHDFSLQADIACAPCHKGPYKYIGCPKQGGVAACCHAFDTNLVLKQVERAYNECYKYQNV